MTLLRVSQWYKNFLVFLPLLFIEQLFFIPGFLRVCAGFIALCAISSSGYILNDILDKAQDRLHPEKKNRAIASGKVSSSIAILLSLALFSFGIIIAYLLSGWFVFFLLLLFALTLWYSIHLKQILFLDVGVLSTNFAIRAVSGALIIYPNQMVRISPWLILVPFFLAFFLTLAKRRANILFLSNPQEYSKVLKLYTKELTSFLFSMATILLIAFYALFTLFSDFPLLVVTLPLVMYAILFFYNKVEQGDRIGRDLEYAFLNPTLLLTFVLWCAITMLIIYLPFSPL